MLWIVQRCVIEFGLMRNGQMGNEWMEERKR